MLHEKKVVHYAVCHIFLLVILCEGSRVVKPKQCTVTDGGNLPLGELKVSSQGLKGLQCGHWKLDGLAGTSCDPSSPNSTSSFLHVEFWRGVDNFTSTTEDAPGQELQDLFVILSRKPVSANVFPGETIGDGPFFQFDPPLGQDDVFLDQAAVVNNRPYHAFIASSVIPLMHDEDSWYVNVMYLSQGGAVPVLQSYAVTVTCLPPGAEQQPCPRTSPVANHTCSGHGKCIPSNQDPVPGWPKSTVCSCSTGWGDYACNQNITELHHNQTALIPPLSWGYWAVAFQGKSLQSSQLLVEMVRNSSELGMPLLCLKPFLPAVGDNPGTTDLPNRGYVSSTHCDITSYSLVQNQHYIMLTYDAVKDKRYYIAVWNLHSQHSTLVTLTARWVDLEGLQKGAFMCPFGCYGNGVCSDTGQAVVQQVKQHSQLPFNCTCKEGFGGIMCEGSVTPVHLSNSSTRTITLKSVELPPGSWHYYPVYVNPSWFGSRPTDILQGLWQVSALQGVEKTSLVMFLYNTYPRLVLDPANVGTRDELFRKNPVYILPAAASIKANVRFSLQVLPSSLPQFISSGGLVAMLSVNNRDFEESSLVSYTLQLSAARNAPSLPQPYMDIVLGVAAFLMLALVLTLCKRIVATQMARRFGRRNGQTGVALLGLSRAKGVPASVSAYFPTYNWPRKLRESAQEHSLEHKQEQVSHHNVAMEVTTLPGAVALNSSPSSSTPSPSTGSTSAPSISTVSVDGGQQSQPADRTADVEVGTVAVPVEQDRDQTPDDCCAICLCDYEAGELMRQLPCQHDFHCECVDKWMTEHDTCPICRMLLVPNPDELPRPMGSQSSGLIPSSIAPAASSSSLVAQSPVGGSQLWVRGTAEESVGQNAGAAAGQGGECLTAWLRRIPHVPTVPWGDWTTWLRPPPPHRAQIPPAGDSVPSDGGHREINQDTMQINAESTADEHLQGSTGAEGGQQDTEAIGGVGMNQGFNTAGISGVETAGLTQSQAVRLSSGGSVSTTERMQATGPDARTDAHPSASA